jgi:predicted dehydrogenase
LIKCASENNVRLAGVFQNRWSESSRALKSAMDEGRFGAVSFAGCYTQWYRTNQYYQEGGWHGTWQLDGGGAAMNQAVHAIDLLQWIAGPVKTVSAYSAKRAHPKLDVEDTLAFSLELNSGALGCIVATTAMYPGSAARLEIGGEKGTAVLEGYLKTFSFQDARAEDAALLASVKPKIESSAGGANPADVRLELHAANFTSIFNAWEAGRDAETNGTEARKAVAIVLAMYDSARNGGAPVSVDWR